MELPYSMSTNIHHAAAQHHTTTAKLSQNPLSFQTTQKMTKTQANQTVANLFKNFRTRFSNSSFSLSHNWQCSAPSHNHISLVVAWPSTPASTPATELRICVSVTDTILSSVPCINSMGVSILRISSMAEWNMPPHWCCSSRLTCVCMHVCVCMYTCVYVCDLFHGWVEHASALML